ncbi:tetracycline-efflux transporter [Anaeramoeba flamelloides]|uniref:Tetracycline-efflux transporter n=1 Tax=Anaeramoeba flamelloides TaxID=1746091 RepID=A0AAV7YUS8_9EUKA|nr:tetracycline-efflux transporter [Anaeramoeba flamelloides]
MSSVHSVAVKSYFYSTVVSNNQQKALLYEGVIEGSQAALMVFVDPLLGVFSDSFKRKYSFLIIFICTFASPILVSSTKILWLVFIFRLLYAVSYANWQICASYIADLKRPEHFTFYISLTVASTSFGSFIGSLIGLIISKKNINDRVLLLTSSAVLLPNLFIILYMKEIKKEHPKFSIARANVVGALKYLYQRKNVSKYLIFSFTYIFYYYAPTTVFQYYSKGLINWGRTEIYKMFLIYDISQTLVTPIGVKYLIKYFGHKITFLIGGAFSLLSLLALVFNRKSIIFYIIFSISTLTTLQNPCVAFLYERSVPSGEKGTLFGSVSVINQISYGFTRYFSYWVLEQTSDKKKGLYFPQLVFVICILFTLVAIIFYLKIIPSRKYLNVSEENNANRNNYIQINQETQNDSTDDLHSNEESD